MPDTVDLSVIVPCFNEEDNLSELTDRVRDTLNGLDLSWELVLVDDGSSDGTWDVMSALGGSDPRVVGVRHERNMGIVGAWQSGLDACHGFFICIIDADLQYQPEDIGRLWRELEFKNVEIVQGSRNALTRKKDMRYYLSRGLNIFLNTLFSMDLKDNKSGFLVTRKTVFQDILHHRFDYNYFQSFIMVSARQKGYSYTSIETIFEERLVGESFVTPFPARVSILAMIDLVKAFFEYRLMARLDDGLEAFLAEHEPSRQDEPLTGFRSLLLRFYYLSMPLHHWLISSDVRHYYRQLKRSQWLGRDEIIEYQEERLRKLVEHAYFNVPFYRERMRGEGLQPKDIRNINDLKKMPLLTKQDVRGNLYRGLISNDYDHHKILKITTSGSTGEPFECYADKKQLEFRWAATKRSMEWAHYRFGDRQVRFWHQTIGMKPIQIIKERLEAFLSNRMFIPVFDMTSSNIEDTLERMRRFKPVLIDGYAEAFNLLAKFLKDKKVTGLGVKGIISSAQSLPADSRKVIEESFGCKVFDKYGSREFSGIAYECEAHDGHHIVAENYIVEVLNDGRPARPGEVGEVVITDLNNYVMPFIRYRIGDLAVAMDGRKECPCGRGLPRIGEIKGRVQSIIVGMDGQFIPGSFFYHVLKDYVATVRKYQIIQEDFGQISFSVVKGSRFTEQSFEKILSILGKQLGEGVNIQVKFVDNIKMVRTGKHMAVSSRLKIDFQDGSFKKD
ncbi:glycosyltransferase [Candidatus Altiarchaeota archaeon]